jgi:hypothetical protein
MSNAPLPILVEGRECGSCVICCKTLEIDEPGLRKPAGTLCPHCPGTGCAIYADRPGLCRTWYCMWRRLSALPDDLRPDRCGVVFWLDRQVPPRTPFDRIFIVGQAVDNPAAFSRPGVKAAIDLFAQRIQLPIWLGFGGERRLVYPDPALQDAILNPRTTPWQSLVPAALAWRKNYGID